MSLKDAYIINGHVPVKCKNGESPIKCNGRVMIIDGGFSKAYQKETGIAGYTLVYNSYGLLLVAHEPFESAEAAIEKGSDIHSENMVIKTGAETPSGRRYGQRERDHRNRSRIWKRCWRRIEAVRSKKKFECHIFPVSIFHKISENADITFRKSI